MQSDREYLEELQQELTDFQREVEQALQQSDEDPINRHKFGLVRSVLQDLDERRERQEFIHSLEPGTRAFIPPYREEDAIGNTSRRRQMMELRRSIFRAWDEATSTFIAGRYYAATVTITAVIEGVLKHELEKEGTEYEDWNTSLSDAVSKARKSGIIPPGGKVSEAADRVKTVRNDLIHYNIERGLNSSEFSSRDQMDRRSPTDLNGFQKAGKIEMWRDIAETTIEDAYLIANYIHQSE